MENKKRNMEVDYLNLPFDLRPESMDGQRLKFLLCIKENQPIHQSEISRKLNWSYPKVMRYIDYLKDRYLKDEKIGNMIFISLKNN